MAIASQPRCPLPGDSFLRRVYWARLVSSRAFRICCFPLVIRPSRQSTGCNSAARPPAAGKAPDSCSGRLIPPPCNAGMSRSGCPVRATLEELVAEKAGFARGSCFRRSCRQISPLRSSQELRPGLSVTASFSLSSTSSLAAPASSSKKSHILDQGQHGAPSSVS